MGQSPQPKFRASKSLAQGDFLSISVWQGKSNPEDEVINVQIRRIQNGDWKTVERLALYRTSDGSYSQLPDRQERASAGSDSPSAPAKGSDSPAS